MGTGTTFGALMDHILKDVRIPTSYYEDGQYLTPMAYLLNMMRINDAMEEAATEDPHPEAVLMVQLFKAFCTFHKIVKGPAQVAIVDKMSKFGVDWNGFDLMTLIPDPNAALSE